jgi:hypothetical protein
MWSEINVSGHFLWVQTFLNEILFEFLENIVFIKFWMNSEKPFQFWKQNFQKSGEKIVILRSCFANVHTHHHASHCGKI